jgi:threonine/homoserine/homoserine lactone efflux protein
MPDLSTLLLFMVAAGIVVAIPGPNHLYIITRSVSQGRSPGLTSTAGVETGTLVHIAAARWAFPRSSRPRRWHSR